VFYNVALNSRHKRVRARSSLVFRDVLRQRGGCYRDLASTWY